MNPSVDDIALIKSIKKGDAQSLELIFRRLYPRLCAYANKYLNNIDEAEEIVQEVFFRIWKNREQLDEKQAMNAYLFTAVKNNCLNLLQHWKVESKYAELLHYIYKSSRQDISSHESLVAQELEKDFNKALDQLPAECRKVFELSRMEGLKYHEIAAKLNISIKTVETQMFRALHKIRLQLKEYLIILILLNTLE